MMSASIFFGCAQTPDVPTGVQFKSETLKRIGYRSDNWYITWAADGNQITSMCDGNWLKEGKAPFHNRLFRIIDSTDDFSR